MTVMGQISDGIVWAVEEMVGHIHRFWVGEVHFVHCFLCMKKKNNNNNNNKKKKKKKQVTSSSLVLKWGIANC